MKYDFTTILDRRGMDAVAVDAVGNEDSSMAPGKPAEGFDIISMWVADMNFPACPKIPEAIIERLKHPAYGYFELRDEYYDRIAKWQRERNGVQGLTRTEIGYENGVVGGVISALGVFCSRGDYVLVHSPTYIGFTGALKNNGYRIVLSQLKRDSGQIPRMDFADMEEKIRKYHIHAAIFCSPHNPCGRVWEKDEILAFTELCRKYDVNIISDEIWSDIILGNHRHIPTQSVSEDARMRTVALYAPSKTFNIAGIEGAYHIIYNPTLRDKVRREGSLSYYNNANLLSMYALMGAYTPEGTEWLEELREVLLENTEYACSFIETNFPDVEVTRPEGTYMLFPDCSRFCRKNAVSLDELLKRAWDAGVAVQDGRPFYGSCHIRINVASPLSRIKEAFERMRTYVFI